MECDSFDSLPESLRNPLAINEIIFEPLRNFVGPVFSGRASDHFASGDAQWGRPIQLSSTETLQIRVYPSGVISSGNLLEVRRGPILVASRRRNQNTTKDHVALAILWHPSHNVEERFSAFQGLTDTNVHVAAPNLHIVLPSLFNHHDAKFGGLDVRNGAMPAWPILDEQNFHAIRPTSCSVHRRVRMPPKGELNLIAASAGLSQFVIAGHLANIDIEDQPLRTAEPLSHGRWCQFVDKYTKLIEENRSRDVALVAMQNARVVTDVLTCEGILGVLGHHFMGGCMPDMMHSPCGFPLLIAFAARLACYPARFDLAIGTAVDQLANAEAITLFESAWQPLKQDASGGNQLFAIDLAMRAAHSEARTLSTAEKVTMAVVDNMVFWQRAGQRCLTAIFGPAPEDFAPPKTTFGLSDDVVDPLAEARNKVLQMRLNPLDAARERTSAVSQHLATAQEKRGVLQHVMNSVEHWLRTGMYANMQTHAKNKIEMTIQRKSGPKIKNKEDLRNAFLAGMEESVQELIRSGDADSEEKARDAAKCMHDTILAAVEAVGDDDIDYQRMQLQLPVEVAEAVGVKPIDDGDAERNKVGFNKDSVCYEAFKVASSALTSAQCQGPMVHHEFFMSTHLSSPYAHNLCADCDTTIHVLASTFLSSSNGKCARCKRPRCLSCMYQRDGARTVALNPVRASTEHCKRCAADAPPSRPVLPQAVVPGSKGKKKKGN
jgi:hypothetical protein